MKKFHTASDEEIKSGQTTDIYFVRARQILKEKGLGEVVAAAEVTTGNLPNHWPWAVLSGIEEVAHLFEGCPVNVYAMPEGSVFYSADYNNVREPVLIVEGAYAEYGVFETPLLGFLCQTSGIATAATRVKKIAGGKIVISFGIRRQHPAISPMISRACYISGFDGVSCILSARMLGLRPSGTMPHALIIIFGDQVEAWKAYDQIMPSNIPRIALCDTYSDEKAESLMAANAIGDNLWGVRLDTPRTRKGDFARIVREVRWELDLRGHKNVKILVSGGMNEESIRELGKAGADGFGVGTYVSNAPTIDFAMDIVSVLREGKWLPAAKRDRLSGWKNVWRCPDCLTDIVLPSDKSSPMCPNCGAETDS
ncbi:MAG: nicotinate phosphoribosyltransferase, partial [Candidatus Hodarchaeota archaeon]